MMPATLFMPATSSSICLVQTKVYRYVASFERQTLSGGVKRSKREAMRWLRKSAEGGETGHGDACWYLALWMYSDRPHTREVGHVEEAAGVATSAGGVEGHDVPPDVLNSVVHWLARAGYNPLDELKSFRINALEGAMHCVNDGCEVMGHLKDFKVCPQCKIARYCAVSGCLALRANFEVLPRAHHLTPVVDAKLSPVLRHSEKPVEHSDWIMPTLPQPIYHAGQDIRGDVVTLHDPSRHGDSGGLLHMPNLAGVGMVCVHGTGELHTRVGIATLCGLCGLAFPPHCLPLAPRDAEA